MGKKKRDASTQNDSKREERKQRSVEHRAEQERLKKRKALQSRVTFVVVVLALFVAGFLVMRRKEGDEPRDGEVRNGRQWSAAHGHWHDL